MVDKSPVLQPHASHDATNPQTNTCYPISADLIRMAIVATAFLQPQWLHGLQSPTQNRLITTVNRRDHSKECWAASKYGNFTHDGHKAETSLQQL